MITTEWIPFKTTKFVKMYHDSELNGAWVVVVKDEEKIFIPTGKELQVIRGLLSHHQKYYRRKK